MKCEDCGIEIHPQCNHTGHERWCEDCFDRGLNKDMDDHFKNSFEQDRKDLDDKLRGILK